MYNCNSIIPVWGTESCSCVFCLPQTEEVLSLNPYQEVGRAHNRALQALRQVPVTQDLETTFKQAKSYLMGAYGVQSYDFAPYSALAVQMREVIADPQRAFEKIQDEASLIEKEIYQMVLEAALESTSEKMLVVRTNTAVRKVVESGDFNLTQKAKLLGFISLTVESIKYWNSVSDTNFYDETPNGRRIKPWLADAVGFVAGFIGTLIINNNTNGNGNPITTGTGLGAAVSAVFKK